MVLGYIAIAKTKTSAEKLISRIKKQFGNHLSFSIGQREQNEYTQYPVFTKGISPELAVKISEFCKESFGLGPI